MRRRCRQQGDPSRARAKPRSWGAGPEHDEGRAQMSPAGRPKPRSCQAPHWRKNQSMLYAAPLVFEPLPTSSTRGEPAESARDELAESAPGEVAESIFRLITSSAASGFETS
jgi:hypothetical protein